MKTNIKKLCGAFMALCLLLSGCAARFREVMADFDDLPQPVYGPTVELSKERVRDGLLGMWVGSAIGMGSGFEYVTTANNAQPVDGTVVSGKIAYVALADKYWEPGGQVCGGSIGVNPLRVGPVNDPRVEKGKVYSDDDMHVDILNQFIFRDYGPDLSAVDIAAAWDRYAVYDAGGGQTVRDTIRQSGYMPPFTGQRAFGNYGYWVTEQWIENETVGSLFPYMPSTAAAYAKLFTTVQGDALATYLGELCFIMSSLAWQYDRADVVLEKAFGYMDKNNEIYDMYEYVLDCYAQGKTWREACIGAVERSTNCKNIDIADKAGFIIDGNAAMIFIGILYGENDFEKTIKITSLCGLDGDCTGCTVGGLMGQLYGYERIPKKYTDFVGAESIYYNYTGKNGGEVGVNWGAFAYIGANFPNALTFNQIADLTVNNLSAQVTARGGSVGATAYRIASQAVQSVPSVTVSNHSFELNSTAGWTFEAQAAGTSFVTTASKAHLGEYGGLLSFEDTSSSARVYQTVPLTVGNSYKVSVWINGFSDREVRLFAKGKATLARGATNPLSVASAFVKLEMYFTADTADTQIGVEVPAGNEDAWSTMLYIDDFYVEDYTHVTVKGHTAVVEAEQCYLAKGTPINDVASASGKKTITLDEDGGLRFGFRGISRGFIKVKIYYGNYTGQLAGVAVALDGKKVGNVPLFAQTTEGDYNPSNFVMFTIYADADVHMFKLTLATFEAVAIDRIELESGHSTFC